MREENNTKKKMKNNEKMNNNEKLEKSRKVEKSEIPEKNEKLEKSRKVKIEKKKRVSKKNQREKTENSEKIKYRKKFDINDVYKSLKINKYFLFILFISLLIYCKKKKKSFISCFLTLLIVSFIGYFVHLFSHNINLRNVLDTRWNDNYFMTNKYIRSLLYSIADMLDFHDITHHNSEVNKTPKNITYEALINFLTQGGFLYIFYYLVKNSTPEMYLLWAFMYTTIHNINYVVMNSQIHKDHHADVNTNLFPDFWDIMCNTKYPIERNGKIEIEIEDFNNISLNLIIGLLLLYWLF